MSAGLWQLRQWARRLGAVGLVGLGLLGAALLMQGFQVESLQQTIRTQQARLATLQQTAARRAATPAPLPLNPLASCRRPAKRRNASASWNDWRGRMG